MRFCFRVHEQRRNGRFVGIFFQELQTFLAKRLGCQYKHVRIHFYAHVRGRNQAFCSLHFAHSQTYSGALSSI